MAGGIRTFGHTAKGLAKNPLGIIALFIVLVYGFASLVTIFGSSFAAGERTLLIYFLAAFPVLVLCVFAWLVSRHPDKLYGPGDYRDDESYIRMHLIAAASLGAATAKPPDAAELAEPAQADWSLLTAAIRSASPEKVQMAGAWRKRILWVDDRPNNNIYERAAFEAIGLSFSLALSTNEALALLDRDRYGAIISDMGRREGPQEGYVLLEAIRGRSDETPFFIYAGSNLPEHRLAATRRGAQGSTNSPQELFEMVIRAVLSGVTGE